LINDILWGNVNGEPGNEEYLQIAFGESSSNPNFYNCIIQGGTKSFQSTPEVTYSGDTINIFDINPAFIKPAAGAGANFSGLSANWCVQDTSSCINNGTNDALKHLPSVTDIAGNPRIIHGYIDIGAYEKRIVKIEASGSIEEYTRWIADTLEIKGDIKVRDSITLDIAPGTYIEFQGYHKMAVEGTILAIGTVKDPITFTINDTAGFTNRSITKGGWYGISFDNSDGGANGKMSDNDTSKLIHCTIEYAKDYDSLFLQGGAIKTNYFSKLIIKNCTIRYNNAYSGGGIGLMSGSSPLIDGNIIYRNTARRRGGGISCEQKSEARIINNIISNNSLIDNTGWPKGGGGLACNSADPFILNNIICNNESLFAWGGGINLFDSYPTFANNTVCNNLDRGGWSGGGIFAQCDPVIFNTILWGNVSGTDTLQVTSDNHPDFYNCNIQGGRSGIGPFWYDYQGLTIEIQDGNPRFKSPTQGAGIEYDGLAADWSITEFSPNINAGMPDVSGLNLPEIRELIGESLI